MTTSTQLIRVNLILVKSLRRLNSRLTQIQTPHFWRGLYLFLCRVGPFGPVEVNGNFTRIVNLRFTSSNFVRSTTFGVVP